MAIVGAWADDHPSKANAGSAYIFNYASANWHQSAKLSLGSAAAAGDEFGISVGIQYGLPNSTAVIGATHRNSSGISDSGAAYVFNGVAGAWTLKSTLVATSIAAGNYFGNAVAIHGNTIAVASAYENPTPSLIDIGAVYVFVGNEASWSLQQKLVASSVIPGDNFGSSVGLRGNLLIAGAIRDSSASPTSTWAGAAYIYERAGNSWTEQQKLITLDPDPYDYAGWSVGIDGYTAVVGAGGDDGPMGATDIGATYLFVKDSGTWIQKAKFVATGLVVEDRCGRTVLIQGDEVVVGCYWDDTSAGGDAGSARLVEYGTWTILPGCFGNPAALASPSPGMSVGGTLDLSLTTGLYSTGIGLYFVGVSGLDSGGCGTNIPGLGELMLGLAPSPAQIGASAVVAGQGSLTVTVPNVTSLIAQTIWFQAANVSTSGSIGAIELSNGLLTTIKP